MHSGASHEHTMPSSWVTANGFMQVLRFYIDVSGASAIRLSKGITEESPKCL